MEDQREINLNRINELIAYGMNRKKIAEFYSLLPATFGRRFITQIGVPFTRYKRKLLQSLKDGTY